MFFTCAFAARGHGHRGIHRVDSEKISRRRISCCGVPFSPTGHDPIAGHRGHIGAAFPAGYIAGGTIYCNNRNSFHFVAHSFPEKLAFIIGEKRLTYKEFNEHVNQLANALLASGLCKGEKISTVLPNSLELMTAYWAAAKTGIVIVPCSPILQESGLFNLLADSDTVFVLADSAFGAILERMKEDLPTIRGCVLVGGQKRERFPLYNEFISGSSGDNPPDADLSDSDVYNIM